MGHRAHPHHPPEGVEGPLPVGFYIHGAGWVLGDENTHDRLFRELVVGANVTGVFPVYDRAPEHPYPTQIEQNYAVGSGSPSTAPSTAWTPAGSPSPANRWVAA